jgi:hypothetical protein
MGHVMGSALRGGGTCAFDVDHRRHVEQYFFWF